MADKVIHAEEGDPNDYSCYITITNESDSDLLLADFGIVDGYGKWPLYQPLNTIEARSTGRVHLQDPKVNGGSEGWVLYEVKVGDRTEKFKLSFDDPQSFWKDNHLRAESSDNNRLTVKVGPYSNSGHPFYGEVKVSTNPNAVAEEHPTAISRAATSNGEIHTNYEIGFDWPGPGEKYPVHESIAIAAFLQSSIIFPKATTYNNLNPKQWEYFRGILWNDDPRCLLFDDRENDSRDFGAGVEWYNDFLRGSDSGMTRRSHFGDLQFLHAMGRKEGEKPHDTRKRMLDWIGVMYRLACGNQGVSESDKLRDHLSEHFGEQSEPSLNNTLRDLILATTPGYRWSQTGLRALGICMHTIQDSYAIGHVQRRLRNPQDFTGRDDNGFFQFRQGTTGRWGAILAFHTYGSQDDKRHSHYDGLEGGDLPSPRDLASFDRLVGARDAIDACTVLINAFAQKRSWKKLRKELEERVFEIDAHARDCNSSVDEWPTSYATMDMVVAHIEDFDFEDGLAKKMSALEAGFLQEGAHEHTGRQWSSKWQSVLAAIFLCVIMAVLVAFRIY